MSDLGIAEDVVEAIRHALVDLGFQVPTHDPDRPIVAGEQADALFDGAATHLGDEAIGANVTLRVPIGSFGILDYGFCTSSTLRDALAVMVRYFGIATQRARLELIDDGELTRLVYHRVAPRMSRHWVEFALAIIALRMRQVAGPVRLAHVRFVHSRPTLATTHDEFFGTPVEFGASYDELALPTVELDRTLMTASRALAAVLEQKLRDLVPVDTDPELDKIRRTLAMLLDEGRSDVEALAERLATSRRTLQRNLSQLGTSHTALLDDLRRQRARPLLESGMKVADVATRLGFADPSSFFRAYRRWTGTSPTAARKTE